MSFKMSAIASTEPSVNHLKEKHQVGSYYFLKLLLVLFLIMCKYVFYVYTETGVTDSSELPDVCAGNKTATSV